MAKNVSKSVPMCGLPGSTCMEIASVSCTRCSAYVCTRHSTQVRWGLQIGPVIRIVNMCWDCADSVSDTGGE